MTISIEQFGKDHWSLFAYVECRCVDNKGELHREHLRCNIGVHPMLGHMRSSVWNPSYGTRLKGYWDAKGAINQAFKLTEHDDWDCLEDLERAGLIDIISLVNGFVKMTDLGHTVAGALRQHKAEGKNFAEFEFK